MKTISVAILLTGLLSYSFGQGTVHFANSSSTLISANGLPMPTTREFIFAVFIAAPIATTSQGQTPGINDSWWQTVAGYTTNHPVANGGLVSRNSLDVGSVLGFGPGSTVDFLVRGWSANLGHTWAAFLSAWNGSPFPDPGNFWFGSSTIGNDILLGGGTIPTSTLFGVGTNQVSGFGLWNYWIPEPTCGAFLILGAALLLRSRGRRLP